MLKMSTKKVLAVFASGSLLLGGGCLNGGMGDLIARSLLSIAVDNGTINTIPVVGTVIATIQGALGT